MSTGRKWCIGVAQRRKLRSVMQKWVSVSSTAHGGIEELLGAFRVRVDSALGHCDAVLVFAMQCGFSGSDEGRVPETYAGTVRFFRYDVMAEAARVFERAQKSADKSKDCALRIDLYHVAVMLRRLRWHVDFSLWMEANRTREGALVPSKFLYVEEAHPMFSCVSQDLESVLGVLGMKTRDDASDLRLLNETVLASTKTAS